MRSSVLFAALIVGALTANASAQNLSTSAINPSPIAADGRVSGSFPAAEGETSYYFTVDLAAGALATQMSLLGTPGRNKSLELELKDPKGRTLHHYRLIEGLAANQEAARTFPVDSKGRYMIVLKTKGPETTSFKLDLGGSAMPAREAATEAAAPFSRSYLAPTALPEGGVITGTAPGGDQVATHYYFAADLKAGDLMSQISFRGRANAPKMLELALLDGTGRVNPNSRTFITDGLAANRENTRVLKVDSTGRHVVRVTISGVEGTQFKVELGGSALTN
jgi:hypothetical protein